VKQCSFEAFIDTDEQAFKALLVLSELDTGTTPAAMDPEFQKMSGLSASTAPTIPGFQVAI
jgi:hypothetical protein